ncbi:MAG: HAD family phosphatase [Bacteroidota bacterium]|nr:HAD family phosphatase [Bacteroidota bacterium]
MKIKNIIFDFGGVILNINQHLIGYAFAKEGVKDVQQAHRRILEKDLYNKIERGEISPQSFYNELKELVDVPLSDEQIKKCWNAMVLDLPAERIRLLESIRDKYRIFMLSNTNSIHYAKYRKDLEKNFAYKDFEEIFEKAYFSHLIGFRKPDVRIFEHVIRDADLKAEETLFIDDVFDNVEAAEKAGITGLHLREGVDVTDLFDEEGLIVKV